MAKTVSERALKQGTVSSRQGRLEKIADQTLTFFAKTASAAQTRLDEPHQSGASTLASVNTFTSIPAVQALDGISADLRRELFQLLNCERRWKCQPAASSTKDLVAATDTSLKERALLL